jgi:hypothetical protein
MYNAINNIYNKNIFKNIFRNAFLNNIKNEFFRDTLSASSEKIPLIGSVKRSFSVNAECEWYLI